METVNIATFILDDDQDLLDVIKDTIDKAGITNYKLFTNEKLFIEGLTDDIHVCVVDHVLTVKTGVDILKEIKAKNDGSFVIAYTGEKNPKTIISYLNNGADRFIDKDDPQHLQMLTDFLHDGLGIATKRIAFTAFIRSAREKTLTTDDK